MQSVKEILFNHLTTEDSKQSEEHRDSEGCAKHFYPSEFFLCLKKRYLSRIPNIKRAPKEAPQLFRFAQGHFFEDLLGEALQSVNIVVHREIPLSDGEFSGRVDFLTLIDDKATAIELKTVHPFALDKLKREGYYKHHKAQIMWYYRLLKNSDKFTVDQMKLFYAGIADSRCIEFTIPYDPFFMEEVDADIAKLMDYWEKKIEPPKEKSWQCKYCDYKEYCNGSN